MSALRRRPFGATARAVAGLSGVSVGHTKRCLRRIEGFGWAHRQTGSAILGLFADTAAAVEADLDRGVRHNARTAAVGADPVDTATVPRHGAA